MIKRVIILGNHIQALGISRIVKKIGCEVVLCSNYKISVSRFSNSVDKFLFFRNYNEILNKIFFYKNDENDTLLIPTNDRMVEFIRDNYKYLNTHFYLSVPTPEIISLCYNKKNTYLKAKELNISIPNSLYPANEDDLRGMKHLIKFPVIIKPAVMYKLYKETGRKNLKCANEKELFENYKKVLKYIPADEVIVQEIIEGGATVLFSYGSFFANNISFGSFIAHRIRQKPMDFGISTTFAKTVVNKDIQMLAEKFLKGINYFGLSEIEFMYDKKSNEYKLIEINPRSWKWHSIANKLNINLFQMLINSLEGKENKIVVNDIENIGWIEHLTDSYVVINEILKGKLTFKEYLKTMKCCKEYACWSWHDPLPGIIYFLLLPYLYFKRY